jgi:spermidine synthase
MKPWTSLGTAAVPGGGQLELREHDGEYVIRADGYDLMVSHAHDSEDAMMALACPRPRAGAQILVGGLGMGYTLRAALDALPADAAVVVAELVPEVVAWNRGPLGPLAGHPLDDPRTELFVGDVRDAIEAARGRFDAMLLDVDNGPDTTSRHESWLYTREGLAAIGRALRPGGTVAVWSVAASAAFERRLRAAGFAPETHTVAGHRGRGTRYVVFTGRKR